MFNSFETNIYICNSQCPQGKDKKLMFQSKGLTFRTPLDNIHPLVDNNKNIQAALCHGTKSTTLLDEKKNLDIATKIPTKSKQPGQV